LGGPREIDQIQEWLDRAAKLAAEGSHDQPLLRLIVPIGEVIRAMREGDAPPSLGAAKQDPDPFVRATAHLLHGHVLLNLGGQDPVAEADLRMAWRLFEQLGERWGLSSCLIALGEIASRRGEHSDSARMLTDAVATLRDLGTTEEMADALVRLAH